MADLASPPGTAGDVAAKVEGVEETELPQQSADAHRVLTPPTSEDMGKHDGSSSELSDMDDDEDDDIGEVFPDHYWDEENGGRIPVFRPTMDQFRSFKKYVEKIDPYGMKSGIVKVIPPKEWRDNLPTLDEAVKSIKVKNPITQEFAGTYGKYTQANIEKQRSYNLPQWKALTLEPHHQPPAKRGERRREAPPPKTKPVRSAAPSPVVLSNGQRRGPGRPRKSAIKMEDEPADSVESDPQVPPTPTSPSRADNEDEEEVTPVKARSKSGRKPAPKSGPKAKGRQPTSKSVSSRRMNNQQEFADVDEESFKDFDYHLANLDEFTKERCQELEENYWKTINYGTPMYGADMPGSLFDDRTASWNVAKLENLLDVLGTKVPGVNTAYLYLGMWKATFAWHLEDVDLYSINYIHFGAPKQWYSISQGDARKFEQAMQSLWDTDYKHCDQFLRHKTYLISPEKLMKEFNIKVNKLVHYEGEFVITYPYGYHSGYNLGYNCAESVNFATEKWLDYGKIARKCNCEADSVWVDVEEIKRKLNGEPTPEYMEVTDDESDGEEASRPALQPPPKKKKTAGRPSTKRKREEEKKAEPVRPTKRVKLVIRSSGPQPCVLCPNNAKFDVLLPTDTGKQAHKLCASYTPETFILVEDGKEKVYGVANIDKARLDLKCNFCLSKRGSCFQCDSKKCTRAFHATCALAAGVLVDAGPVPTWSESGEEFYMHGFDFRCRYHRPRRPKTCTLESLEKNKMVHKYAKGVKAGDFVQALMLTGPETNVFGGIVVENRLEEGCVVVDIEPEGIDRIELEYKYLLTLDPAESLRAKPSPEAKPLPEHLSNDKNINSSNRQDGVPEMGDAFLDPDSGHKWHEWNAATTAEIRNPYQTKVDVSKPEKLWYYLGKTSTEARQQFTDDPKRTVHNPKSSFLDSVKPPPAKAIVAARRISYPANYQQYPATSYPPARAGYQISNPAGTAYGPNGAGYAQRPPPGGIGLQYSPAKPYEYKPKAVPAPNAYPPMPYGYGSPGFQPIRSQPPSTTQYATSTHAPSYSNHSAGQTVHSQTPTLYQRAPSTRTPSTQPPAPPPARLDNSPRDPNFYVKAEQKYSRQQPMINSYQALASPKVAPVAPSRATGVAAATNITNPTASDSFTPPSQRGHSSSVPGNDYLNHIQGGGFSPEYQRKLPAAAVKPEPGCVPSLSQQSNPGPVTGTQSPSLTALPANSAPQPKSQTQSHDQSHVQPHSQAQSQTHHPRHAIFGFGGQSNSPIPQQVPRSHMVQYQTTEQFKQHVSREVDTATSPTGSKFDLLISQIKQGLNSSPSETDDQQPVGSNIATPGIGPAYNQLSTQSKLSQSNATQNSSSSKAPSPSQPYNLPPLQSWGPSSYTKTPATMRTSSRGGQEGSDISMAQTSSGSSHQEFHTPTTPTISGTQTVNSAPHYAPPLHPRPYTPQMRSPERPDYSPLSDTTAISMPTSRAHAGSLAQDLLHRSSSSLERLQTQRLASNDCQRQSEGINEVEIQRKVIEARNLSEPSAREQHKPEEEQLRRLKQDEDELGKIPDKVEKSVVGLGLQGMK